MQYIIAIVLGYFIGSINPAYLIAKSKGFDIRSRGSFSSGASNAKVTMGWKYFVIVCIIDMLKCVLTILFVRFVLKYDYSAQMAAGAAVVYGHVFPFYMQFHGGKGFAAFLGLSLIVNWKFTIIVILVGGVLTLLCNWIVIMTFIEIFSLPIFMAIKHYDLPSILFVSAATLLIFCKHLVNIKKLINHKEIGVNGCYIGTKIKPEE